MSQPLRTHNRHERTAPPGELRHTGLLLVGFLAVTAAVFVAHRSPAHAYELSIYGSTPVAFWAGAAVAVACALSVAFSQPAAGYRNAAWLLAAEGFLAILGLPVIRGYEFYGSGDSLSHMGWIRNVLGGEIPLVELIYPGAHTVAIYFHRLLDIPIDHAMLLTVVAFAALFVLFVPIVAYVLTESTTAATVAVFSAMLVLPINNVSIHFAFFPSTLAVFFVPFVLLLTVVALSDTAGGRVTPVDALLGLGAVSLVFYHPQQAVNLLLVFVTITLAVLGYRRRTGNRSLDPLARHTTVLTLFIAGWTLAHQRIVRTAATYTDTVATVLLEGGAEGGGAVAQRTGSLAAIGVSPVELGLKLFLPSAVFAVLTVLLVLSSVLRSRGRDVDSVVLAIGGLGIVPVGVVMIVYMLGDLQTIYFRHLGFIMLLATIFGAIAIARGLGWADEHEFETLGVGVVSLGIAILLVISLATVFSSPFIHKSNGHVTETRMEGYETAFEHEVESTSYVGVRSGPDRFRDAITGTFVLDPEAARRSSRVPYGELDSDLTGVFDGPRYLALSPAEIQRETLTYHNLRYSNRGFGQLGSGPGVDRVITAGGFRLYHIDE